MTQEKKEEIIRYLQNQISQADFRARAYVLDERGKKNPHRNAFVKLNMYLTNFLRGETEVRWLMVPGLRGVGKTTLLSQLYSETRSKELYKLYLSVDQAVHMLGVSLQDILGVYEELIGYVFERLDKPLILFLDEVHYDSSWAVTLKTVFDRSRKVFILATGSSALTLQTDPDVTRRAVFEKLFPMCFTEYMKIKEGKYEKKGLASDLRKVIFESRSADEVYDGLRGLEQRVRSYWLGVDRLETSRYLKYGTLPFMVRVNNEALAYDQAKKTLDRVISVDIPELGQFSAEIVSRIPVVLYTAASSDILSVTSLSKSLEMNKGTLTDILSVLEKTEVLTRIYPYGSHYKQVRKPSKYLFTSPAFRSMYFNFIGSVIDEESYKGKLLEDVAGLYLTRFLFGKIGTSLTYDSARGGADFIVRFGDESIVLEVGYGQKDFKQITKTSEKVKSKYGLSVSTAPLSISSEVDAVRVPLNYFLLL